MFYLSMIVCFYAKLPNEYRLQIDLTTRSPFTALIKMSRGLERAPFNAVVTCEIKLF